MAIIPLSASTIRDIGSSLVLLDAKSVVKELIDNALDANSTTIAIEISSDTLSIIQVRDNGSGIGIEDRQLVCRRSCTSKIRGTEDLETLGGRFLGFRGEALASTAALSDSLTVTTRTEGETVGSGLKYGPDGILASSFSASHPVGTTTRVQNFLKHIPVRKQTAIKASSKTIASIKKLLFAYAFARPSVKFSFKVLKGKNDKASWHFAGVRNPENLVEAASLLLGPEIATRCRAYSTSESAQPEGSPNQDFRMTALLCIANSDQSNVSDSQYVTVDGRPVSPLRGTVREVVKLYSLYYHSAAENESVNIGSGVPFLCLHVECPPGSYDVNVEPAKDQVLFTNPTKFISSAEKLFAEAYGPLKIHKPEATPRDPFTRSDESGVNFSLLMAHKPPKENGKIFKDCPKHDIAASVGNQPLRASSVSTGPARVEAADSPGFSSIGAENDSATSRNGTESSSGRIHFEMYSMDEEDAPEATSAAILSDDHEIIREDERLQSSSVTNPWSIAKLNAVIPSNPKRPTLSPSTPNSNSSRTLSPENSSQSNSRHGLSWNPGLLPSTSQSLCHSVPFQNPGPPMRRWSKAKRNDRDVESDFVSTSAASLSDCDAEKTLDSWVKTRVLNPFKSPLKLIGSEIPRLEIQESPVTLQTPAGSRTSVQSPAESPRSPASLLKLASRHSESELASDRARDSVFVPASYLSNPEFAQIMDFEHRKRAVNQQNRKVQGILEKPFLNPAKLACIQQRSLRRGGYPSPSTSLSSPGLRDGDDGGPRPLNSRFALPSSSHLDDDVDISDAESAGRGFAASLHRSPQPLCREQDAHLSRSIRVSEMEPKTTSSENNPKLTTAHRLHNNDPRAYLMCHQDKDNDESLKVAPSAPDQARQPSAGRTKSSSRRLPLESIPKESMTLFLVTLSSAPELLSTASLERSCRALQQSDSYLRGKGGTDSFVSWNPFASEVDRWEKRLKQLVEAQYRASVGGEEVPVRDVFHIGLRTTVRAHVSDVA